MAPSPAPAAPSLTLWKLSAMVPGLHWLGFLMAGYRLNQKPWTVAGGVYAALFFLPLAALPTGAGVPVALASWLAALAHAQRSEQQYRRLIPLFQDPHYRLGDLSEVEKAAQLGLAIDVNRATVDDWLRLPGISIHQARQLVRLTQTGVSLYCVEDLAAVLSLPAEQIQPLAPVLRFRFYGPASTEALQPRNANQASAADLARLPGLGAELAQALVAERDRSGPYRDLADLVQRLALPPDHATELLHWLRF